MNQKRVKQPNGVSFGLFIMTIFLMAIAVSLAVVKIYLSNQIYYESRRINYIEGEVEALREENTLLRNQLQRQKFKNSTSDLNFFIE